MKRIPLKLRIKTILYSGILQNLSLVNYLQITAEVINDYVHNNYRRRQYHKKGYYCHCGKFHKPMQLCKGAL
jgi:hypothetical protein